MRLTLRVRRTRLLRSLCLQSRRTWERTGRRRTWRRFWARRSQHRRSAWCVPTAARTSRFRSRARRPTRLWPRPSWPPSSRLSSATAQSFTRRAPFPRRTSRRRPWRPTGCHPASFADTRAASLPRLPLLPATERWKSSSTSRPSSSTQPTFSPNTKTAPAALSSLPKRSGRKTQRRTTAETLTQSPTTSADTPRAPGSPWPQPPPHASTRSHSTSAPSAPTRSTGWQRERPAQSASTSSSAACGSRKPPQKL